jgi:hypothetical protein
MDRRYQTFAEFWPFYLKEHSHPLNRRLHFIGTTLVNVAAVTAIVLGRPWLVLLCPLLGYGFAWFGHFRVEHNRPATFTYPLWSLRGDYKMYGRMLRGDLWGRVPVSGATTAHEAERR